jgi:hypothetical protein
MLRPAIEGATSASEARKLRGQAMEPVRRMIAEDEAAARASRSLIDEVGRDVASCRPEARRWSGGTSFSLGLPPGTSIFVPPMTTCARDPRREEKSSWTPIRPPASST